MTTTQQFEAQVAELQERITELEHQVEVMSVAIIGAQAVLDIDQALRAKSRNQPGQSSREPATVD